MALKTPLYNHHVSLKGKMVDFAGFDMPVLYSSIIEEHNVVREKVGLFDISHMGEIYIQGPESFEFIDYVAAGYISKLFDGKVAYTPICNDSGGVVDDVLVYQFSKEKYLLVVNASNRSKLFKWLQNCLESFENKKEIVISDKSSDYALLALQGPFATRLLNDISFDESDLSYYEFKELEFEGRPVILSRTGYTGEDGFEIFIKSGDAIFFWELLLQKGEKYGVMPIGLGARDTLRLEVCFSLYGHELNDEWTPIESGIGWTLDYSKGNFVGKSALLKSEGFSRKLIAFELEDKGVAREGFEVFSDEVVVGVVTSGSFLPSLGKAAGLAMVNKQDLELNDQIDIKVRNRFLKANVVKRPLYIPLNRRKK